MPRTQNAPCLELTRVACKRSLIWEFPKILRNRANDSGFGEYRRLLPARVGGELGDENIHGRDIGPNSAARWRKGRLVPVGGRVPRRSGQTEREAKASQMKSMRQASKPISFLSVPSPSLLWPPWKQLITLGLRRFIALHSSCTNAPDSDSFYGTVAAATGRMSRN